MNRPPQTLRFEQLWTLFIDGELSEQQDLELATWLAEGGRVERGTIEDLDCHQLLRAEGHTARTENDFVCDLITRLSPQFSRDPGQAAAEDVEATARPFAEIGMAVATNDLRPSSLDDRLSASARGYWSAIALSATLGSFLAVVVVLCWLSVAKTPATPAVTAALSNDGGKAVVAADLESDPVTAPVESLVTFPTQAEGHEAGAVAPEVLELSPKPLEEESAITDSGRLALSTTPAAAPDAEAPDAEGPDAEGAPSRTLAPLELAGKANRASTEKAGEAIAVAARFNAAVEIDGAFAVENGALEDEVVAEVEDEAVAEVAAEVREDVAAEKISGHKAKEAPTTPPVKLKLLAAKDAKWESEPTDIQHELLTLTEGEATIGGEFGKLTIKAPSTVFLDLPTRVTLQDGELSVAVKSAMPLMIDTAFGSAVARGRAQIVANVDGMSVRAVDRVTVSSPAESWEIENGAHKLVTATGDAFDWYASLDLTKDLQCLVLNGATATLGEQNFESKCARQIASALVEAERSARQQQRLDFNGVLRVNSMVKVYKKARDLTVARSDAEQFVTAARRARAGRASSRSAPSRQRANRKSGHIAKAAGAAAAAQGGFNINGAGVNGGVNAAAAVGMVGAVMNNAINANALPANAHMADLMERAMQPMTAATAKMPPASVPKDIPRLQLMNDQQLQQHLLTLPEVEVYRDDREAFRMTRELGKMSRLDARSVPPRREPVFEILATRPDLQGLPYLRGEQCRLPRQQQAATASLSRVSGTMGGPFLTMSVGRGAGPAQLPGLVQILQAKSPAERVALNRILLNIGTFEALQTLAKRALFDVHPIARHVAIVGLKGQQAKIRPQLLDGLRYPWAPAAAHAAEALVRLEDKEAIPALIAMLDEPHPSAPEMVNGKWMTREVVRLNHMKNCILCHAPSTSQKDLMRARVPVPGNSQVSGPDPVGRYYGPQVAPGPFVRADITYLRQDFSITSYTDEHAPWPKQQRSDFLVRSRRVTAQEMLLLNQRPLGRDYPQRHAVLFALKQLTGLDLGNDSASWRAKLLAKN